METPARAAERLLLGVGLALLLATAFALIDGRLPPAECPEEADPSAPACTASDPSGWWLPAMTALTLCGGIAMRMSRTSGSGALFPSLFPDGGESEIVERLAQEHADAHDTDRLSTGWAEMEAKMLGGAEEE